MKCIESEVLQTISQIKVIIMMNPIADARKESNQNTSSCELRGSNQNTTKYKLLS